VGILEWHTERLQEQTKWIEDNAKAWQLLVIILAIAAVFILATLSPIAAVVLAIIAIIAIIANWGKIWEWLKGVGKSVLDSLKAAWSTFGAWFQRTVIDPVSNGFNTLLDSLSIGWQRTWDGIKGFVKNTVNGIIDLINGMLRAVAGGLNAVIGSMNSLKVNIPDWVPNFGGKSFGLSIPTVGVPQIPRLARGAVIPPNAEFLAVLGDQRNGNNIEAPQALLEQMLERAVAGAQGSQQVTINFTGSMAELVRILKPKIDQEYVRADSSLVSSGGAA
jgi:energy-coupling factor transporter transmembrane protein EcfT